MRETHNKVSFNNASIFDSKQIFKMQWKVKKIVIDKSITDFVYSLLLMFKMHDNQWLRKIDRVSKLIWRKRLNSQIKREMEILKTRRCLQGWWRRISNPYYCKQIYVRKIAIRCIKPKQFLILIRMTRMEFWQTIIKMNTLKRFKESELGLKKTWIKFKNLKDKSWIYFQTWNILKINEQWHMLKWNHWLLLVQAHMSSLKFTRKEHLQ